VAGQLGALPFLETSNPMTTLLDRIETSAEPRVADVATPAQRLRTTMAASRVRFTWFGVQKTLTSQQKSQAAEAFDADGQSLSATKKLIDTRHTAFRAVTAVRTKITDHWRSLSLPFPEPGIRLVRQESIETFAAAMADFKTELEDAVANLDRVFDELRQAAAGRLGSLYNPQDYPETLGGLFDVAWDFPSLEPPDYVVALSPQVYEQERARVVARFEEAVRLAEQAFLEEFARHVEHLTERVTGKNDDGSAKVFRDSAVGNLTEFFARFRDLNVQSDSQLEALVEQAQRAVRGVAAQDLRDSEGLRQRVATQLARVQTSLDSLLIERPRRRILRPALTTGDA
jgi:hypothetical protein